MSFGDDPRWHEIERTLDELVGAIDTNVVGCVEIEKRGEAARKTLEELRRDVASAAPQPPLARDPEWPPSECVCAETSTRNCPVHQNAGDPEWPGLPQEC